MGLATNEGSRYLFALDIHQQPGGRLLEFDWEQQQPMIFSEFGAGAKAGNHGPKHERWNEEYQEYFYRQTLAMAEEIPFLRGASPYLAALTFAYSSNLNGSLTHYATGPSPISHGSGYVDLPTWWRLGFLISIVNITIWTDVGFPYWKALGLW